MKALVISGGGNKGAFAGGIAEYLIKEQQQHYDLFLGTSTGSLLIPLISIGKINKIKEVFTSVKQQSIFNISPFLVYKNRFGEYKTRINHLNVLKRLLRNKKTLGESRNLLKLIRRSFTEDDFKILRQSEKDVVVTVSNISSNNVEYKHSGRNTYDDFCEWVWISANLIPFMSLVVKDGFEYADGGFSNFVPIKKAIDMGADEIDAVVLHPKKNKVNHISSRNSFDTFLNVFGFMMNQIAVNDIDISRLHGKDRKVKINYYFIPDELSDNPLLFKPDLMKQWWRQGWNFARETGPIVQDSRRRIFSLFA